MVAWLGGSSHPHVRHWAALAELVGVGLPGTEGAP